MTHDVITQVMIATMFLFLAGNTMWTAMSFTREDDHTFAVIFIVISMGTACASGFFFQGAVYDHFGFTMAIEK